MERQDDGYMETLSGNDLGDDVTDGQEPDTGDPDTSGGQSPGQDEGTGGGEPDTGHDTEDKDDKEVSDSSEQEQHEQIITIIEDDDSKEWREGISEQLAELMKPQDTADVTERLDTLIMLLTPEEDETDEVSELYTIAAIPVEGYEGFQYPVEVEYSILFAGYEEYMADAETYDDAETFRTDYEELSSECSKPGSNFKDFYISCIYDAGGNTVYDAKIPEPTPDPGDEEQKEVTEQLLAHLEGINTTLSDMVQADMEYYQMVRDYQAEMLELTAADTGLTLFTCIGVFAIFALLLWSEFFRRFR